MTALTRLSVRPYAEQDEALVVEVWHRAGQAAYTYLPTWQASTLDQARRVFREVILPSCEVWVGAVDENIVAYLAMNGSYIDRLYVEPDHWRNGWGTRLVALAKRLSRNGLELHTHQANNAACVLYEKHGFKPVRFGTSPPPESAPDVEYHWRPATHEDQLTVATFGAGCFWGTEHLLRSVPGVTECRVGYMGGTVNAPTYEAVCREQTGHIEVAEVTYDPARVSYQQLLDVFWQLHDPTSLDDQGPYERGTQYRAAIFYHDAEQADLAVASKAALQAAFLAPIQTEIRPATTLWPAEDYHQRYIAKGGEHHCHVFTRAITLPET